MRSERSTFARLLTPWHENRRLRDRIRVVREQRSSAYAQLRRDRRLLWIWANEAQHLRTMLTRRADERERTRQALMEIIDHGDSWSSRRAAMALAIRRDTDALIDVLRKDATRAS